MRPRRSRFRTAGHWSRSIPSFCDFAAGLPLCGEHDIADLLGTIQADANLYFSQEQPAGSPGGNRKSTSREPLKSTCPCRGRRRLKAGPTYRPDDADALRHQPQSVEGIRDLLLLCRDGLVQGGHAEALALEGLRENRRRHADGGREFARCRFRVLARPGIDLADRGDDRVDGRDVRLRVVVTGPRWLGQRGDLEAEARAGPGS